MAKSGRPRGLTNPQDYKHIGKYAINETKFLSKLVEDQNGCHVWQGGKHRQGYGMVSIYNTEKSHREMTVAHRAAMMLHTGRELGRDDFVVHDMQCTNFLCCNPQHLLLGTAQDRNRVQYAKGRRPTTYKKGNEIKKQNRNYVHTEDELRLQRDGSTDEIADYFGVTRAQASRMKWRVQQGYLWLK